MAAYILFQMNSLNADTGEAALTAYRSFGRPAREKYGGIVRVFEEYYKNDPLGPISDYTLEFINMERSRSDNTLFYVFFFITKTLIQ